MADLVAGFASSHSPMLTADLYDWEHHFGPRDQTRAHVDLDGNAASYAELLARAPADAGSQIAPEALARRYGETRDAMARLRRNIANARLDALIIVGDDQEELFDHTNMPAIGIWHGATIRNARVPEIANPDWQARARGRFLEPGADRFYPCHQPLALHLITALGEVGFDPAAMAGVPDGRHEGHAYSFVHRVLMDQAVVPVVPLFLNAYYPPNQPTPARCFALGEALRRAVAEFPADLRVGILASGGLSHFLVDEAHDRAIIAAFERRDFAMIRAIPRHKLQAGSSEIRNWICLAGAVQNFTLDWISYAPGYRSPALTGTGLWLRALEKIGPDCVVLLLRNWIASQGLAVTAVAIARRSPWCVCRPGACCGMPKSVAILMGGPRISNPTGRSNRYDAANTSRCGHRREDLQHPGGQGDGEDLRQGLFTH